MGSVVLNLCTAFSHLPDATFFFNCHFCPPLCLLTHFNTRKPKINWNDPAWTHFAHFFNGIGFIFFPPQPCNLQEVDCTRELASAVRASSMIPRASRTVKTQTECVRDFQRRITEWWRNVLLIYLLFTVVTKAALLCWRLDCWNFAAVRSPGKKTTVDDDFLRDGTHAVEAEFGAVAILLLYIYKDTLVLFESSSVITEQNKSTYWLTLFSKQLSKLYCFPARI